MKIIDLLNKIANEEEVPKKLSYINKTYLFDEEISNYVNEYSNYDFLIGEDITAMLIDEVEIIEDKKIPEKLNKDRYIGTDLSVEDDMFNKINEIIDYLKSKGE